VAWLAKQYSAGAVYPLKKIASYFRE